MPRTVAMAIAGVPFRSSVPAPQPKPRRRHIRVEGLYPEAPSVALVHAKALLQLIQSQCPEKIGSYIPHEHLERTYIELCDREGWAPLHWNAMARQLGKLTDRKTVKRRGQRMRVYRVPRLASSRGS